MNLPDRAANDKPPRLSEEEAALVAAMKREFAGTHFPPIRVDGLGAACASLLAIHVALNHRNPQGT